MKTSPNSVARSITTLIGVVVLSSGFWLSLPVAAAPPAKNAPAPPAKSDGRLFAAFVPVLRHPRCMNCHSQGDFPRQGDDGHPHTMNVRRGPGGRSSGVALAEPNEPSNVRAVGRDRRAS